MNSQVFVFDDGKPMVFYIPPLENSDSRQVLEPLIRSGGGLLAKQCRY
jgi:hypothetical protein